MTKLVLIDGNAILHRAYHALPPLTSKDGKQINAVYGFTLMLLKIIQDLAPTHIVCAFDTPKPTFRHAEYVGYQAQRPRMSSELSEQFDLVYRVLGAIGIPIFRQEGYEADDIIGTIAKQATDNDKKNFEVDEVVIVTGDRDILQLVTDRIRVYMPIRGLTDAKLFGVKEVIEKMGVKPSQIVDYKALVGDASDNYKGVLGIGPKTAVSLIKQFGSLEGVYKHLGDIPSKISQKLAQGAEEAGLSKKLATIVTDAPITFHLDEAAVWDIKSEKVLKVFAKIGFKTLAKRVQEVGKKIEKEKQMQLF